MKSHFFLRYATIMKYGARFASTTRDDFIKHATVAWIKGIVLPMKLCPWAAREMQGTRLDIKVLQSDKMDSSEDSRIQLCVDVCNEAGYLLRSDNLSALVVVPELSCFNEFLLMRDLIEPELSDHEQLSGIHVATFHPNYQFVDTDTEDVENWTNKSPFPVFHLLKTSAISDAFEKYDGDPDEIWKKNIETLNAIGSKAMTKRMKRIMEELTATNSIDS